MFWSAKCCFYNERVPQVLLGVELQEGPGAEEEQRDAALVAGRGGHRRKTERPQQHHDLARSVSCRKRIRCPGRC